jgi:hypothetical protein
MAKPAIHPIEHPSPHRGRVSLGGQLFGIAAGPAAWIAQLVVDYGVSSYVCYPADTPRRDLPGGGEHGLLLAVNLACLAVALAGFAVSLAGWRRTRAEKPGPLHEMLQIGDGRSRFLAICGLLAAATFAVAILFDTPSALALRLCWSARP